MASEPRSLAEARRRKREEERKHEQAAACLDIAAECAVQAGMSLKEFLRYADAYYRHHKVT